MRKLFCLLLTLCLISAPLTARAEGVDYEGIALSLAEQIAQRCADEEFRAVYAQREETKAYWDEWSEALSGWPGKIVRIGLTPYMRSILSMEDMDSLSGEGRLQLGRRVGTMLSSSLKGQAGIEFIIATTGLETVKYFPAPEGCEDLLLVVPFGSVDVAVTFFEAGRGVGGAQVALVPGGAFSAMKDEMLSELTEYLTAPETVDGDWYEHQAIRLARRVGMLCGDTVYQDMLSIRNHDEAGRLPLWQEELSGEPMTVQTLDKDRILAALKTLTLSSGGSEAFAEQMGLGWTWMLANMAANSAGDARLVAIVSSLTLSEQWLEPEGYEAQVLMLHYEAVDAVVCFTEAADGVCGAYIRLCLPGTFETVLAETAQNP